MTAKTASIQRKPRNKITYTLPTSQYKEKYSRFCTHLRRNWINVIFHEKVAEILENHCEHQDAEEYITDEISPVGSEKQVNIKLKTKDLLGFVKSSTGAGSEWALQWTLVSSIALFEAFVNDIAELVYLSDPKRFLLPESTEPPSIKLELLLESDSKQEAIEKYIEQKLIAIFYGDPSHVFVKYGKKGDVKDGALKLETGNYLNNKCHDELKLYVEMTKRRNVIVHNAGIINSRYINEVPVNYPNKLQLDHKVKVDRGYLFQNIKSLYLLARFYTIKATHTAYKTGEKNKDDELLMKLEKEFR